MSLDLKKLRADTPGIENVIHLNNAGASLMPVQVINAVNEHFSKEICIGGYEAAELHRHLIDNVYLTIAKLINVEPEDIALIENATRAWDMAFYSLPLNPGDIILTSPTEYAGNYIPYLQRQKYHGIQIKILKLNELGLICLNHLEQELDNPKVRLLSFPILATNGGAIQPVEKIGALARKAGVLFFLDACQGVGHLPLDIKKIGCHVLTASGRKYLRGPRGTGFLWIDPKLSNTLEPIWLDHYAARLESAKEYTLCERARRFECWESSISNRLGLGAAVQYTLSLGQENIFNRINILSKKIYAGLKSIPRIRLHDYGADLSGIITFTKNGISTEDIKQSLTKYPKRINVSCSKASSTFIDMKNKGLESVVRVSVHAYNDENEISIFLNAIENIRR